MTFSEVCISSANKLSEEQKKLFLYKINHGVKLGKAREESELSIEEASGLIMIEVEKKGLSGRLT